MIAVTLLTDCLAGKRQAQNKLYHQLAPKMFLVCLRYCKTTAAAEDVLQEGFVRMFTCLHQYRQGGSFEGWVRKIMVNCALQHYRKRTRFLPASAVQLPCLLSVPDNNNIHNRLDAVYLLQLIRRLPPVYQMVFNLYTFEELTHREIARALKISEGTSKSNLHDARRILKQALANYTDNCYSKKAG